MKQGFKNVFEENRQLINFLYDLSQQGKKYNNSGLFFKTPSQKLN